jgi:hypothetical protein
MTSTQILTLARKHLGGMMESSARLCLADAIRLFDDGDLQYAKQRALKSLQYSVGMFHADYRKASV